MLGALAGGDALEIVVLLKDLSEKGLKNLEGNIKRAEHTANSTNFGGFSKATKGLASDAEKAAGKVEQGGGGIGGMLAGLIGLPGPLAAAGIAVGAFAALTQATLPVFEKREHQEKALDIALKAHGNTLDAIRPNLEEAIKLGEQYGQSASDTRAAVLKLTEAGISFRDIEAGLPAVMNLAIAKNISAAEAGDLMAKATTGQARGLADLGIKLPPVAVGLIAQEKASKAVATETDALKKAQEHLIVVQDALKKKHHLTAADALKLKDAHAAVATATDKLKSAEDALGLAMDTTGGKGANFQRTVDAINGATGDMSGSVNALTVKTAKLGDKWETFTTKIGPGLEAMLGTILDLLSNTLGEIEGILATLGQIPGGIGKVIGPRGGPQPWSRGQPPRTQPPPGNFGTRPMAAGGWIGLHGPELIYGGEKGPEFVTRTGNAPSGSGSVSTVHTHIYLDGREIADVVDEHLGRRYALRGSAAFSLGGA